NILMSLPVNYGNSSDFINLSASLEPKENSGPIGFLPKLFLTSSEKSCRKSMPVKIVSSILSVFSDKNS
ncbi:MAG: hypothetical protein K2Y07_13100, partial [Nitrosomonas sp.]|nr:hypothetical protein [Nitrosomonas sp.]